MSSIPSPVIFDILLQLRIKSLTRFKALNKLCHSFIRDPDFISTHFKNGAKEANKTLCFILSRMEHRSNRNSIIHFVTVVGGFNHEFAVINAEYSVPVSLDSYHVLPSCKGLVCFYGLHGAGTVHVCNPSTRDIFTLPDIVVQGFRSLSCGFGFDEISGKYKVIKFLEPDQLETDDAVSVDNNLRIKIFTMGDRSWRTISYHPRFWFPNHQPPVFSGRYFYWITAVRGGTPSFSIVSFDIRNEMFESIYPPGSVLDKKWYNLYLVEMRGQLCLVDLDYEDRKQMEIWVFKGKPAQWTEMATIVHPSEPIDTTRPVAFNGGDGDEILLHGYIKGLGHLNVYNVKTACFRPLEIKGTKSNNIAWQCCHIGNHVESLVPC